MPLEIVIGLAMPFLGTLLGSACVFLMRGELSSKTTRALTGFAAGVMAAASIWSLLQPAMDESAALGRLAFMPAVVGYWIGTLFLLILDHLVPHIHLGPEDEEAEGPHVPLRRTTLMVLAVTLHNLPEGMAVGVVFASWVSGHTSITLAAAMSLAIGIAIQNFPEGAIISMPLHAQGRSKFRAFIDGTLSGVVEPLGGLLTILAARHIIPLLPYTLGFAAGAMMYVVVEELIPEMSEGEHSDVGVILFALGFSLMMALDVALA